MKNVFIIGVPRSGKSTLSKLIKRKYPIYNQISFEAIRNGFIESQPELNMGSRNSRARKDILPKHIITLAKWNSELLSFPTLIEGDFCNIEELYSLSDEKELIICLGLGCRSIEEIIEGIKKNDTNGDYTKAWSEKQIRNHFHDIMDKDVFNYNFCKKNNIKYYDTYTDRLSIFENILNDMEK